MLLQEKIRQQGVHESLYRDIIAGYAKWEFDPVDISNPFPDDEGSVHILARPGRQDHSVPNKPIHRGEASLDSLP